MTVVRRLARPLLASAFVVEAVETLRNPKPRVEKVEPVAPALTDKLSFLPKDPTSLVRLNAAVQIGAGLMLATGRLPRLSSTVLAASLVPTTVVAHRFWEEQEPSARDGQRAQFAKNMSMLGGLLFAAVDTEGRPGLAWRARHATQHAAASTARTRRAARREAKLAATTARAKLPV